MWQMWIIIAGIFFIAEIFTTGFLVFWFGVGALFSMVASFFTQDIIIQTVIFIIASVIFIIATKPLVNKFLKTKSVNTNAFSIIGKHGVVIKEINSIKGTGQIKVEHEVWTAEELNHNNVPEGTEVVVNKIEGVKAIVIPIK